MTLEYRSIDVGGGQGGDYNQGSSLWGVSEGNRLMSGVTFAACENNSMRLVINGETREVSCLPTLLALLEALAMKPDRVAVELNRDIVARDRWAETPLRDGDRLEIVHFVGGG
jgi:sulfur carrier protein